MTYLEEQIEKLKQEKYNGNETPDFLNDRKRLEQGEPYEYIVGHTKFLSATIDLSLRPMIPRYETAFWVARTIDELKTKHGADPIHLADTFAGAGNVGAALLLELPNATLDISELDPALKEQIAINMKINNIDSERVSIISASGLEQLTGPYDAIFAVPPYVPHEALPNLDPEMIHFEPHLAFFARENGHEFHRILINGAWKLLKDGGSLYMEADMDHEADIREMLIGTPWSSVEFWPDPYGATPNVVLRK